MCVVFVASYLWGGTRQWKFTLGIPQGVYLGPGLFLWGTVGFKKKGGGRLAVVRPPRGVAGHGSHDAAALRAPFQLSFQIALAFAAAHLFLLGKE